MESKWSISNIFKGDKVIWGAVVILMIYSLLAVYSSSVSVAFKSYGGNTAYFLRSQFIMLIICFFIIWGFSRVPYVVHFKLSGIFFLGGVALLLMTIFFGVNINGATRSLEIPGIGFRLQASEVAKVGLIVYLAASLSRHYNELKDFKVVTLYMFLPIVIVCGLIFKDNLSTAVLVFFISIVLLYIGGVPLKFLFAYMGSAVLLFLLAFLFYKATHWDALSRFDTWMSRIVSYFSDENNPDADFQSTQAEIAIANGGLIGRGLGHSTQRNMLPQSNSDYIFAIIIEEYGLIFGAFVLLLTYTALMYRGVVIAKQCDKIFPAYLVIGLTIMIVIQALLNMMVAVGLFPVTGQTLPMISRGRTSVLMMSVAIGIILSVSRSNNMRKMKQEELTEEEKEEIKTEMQQ